LSGKKSNFYKLNIGGLKIYVAVMAAKNVKGDIVAEASREIESSCPYTVVAGLPDVKLDLCAIAVSYIHAIEHKIRSGRVRSVSLRFIMEYMSLRQIRDAVRATQRGLSYIVLASSSPQCLREAISKVSTLGRPVALSTLCDMEVVSEIVEAGVRSGARFD